MNKAYNPINWENYPSRSTPINEDNLNKMDSAINTIDDRVIVHETTKANQSELLTALADVTFDESAGIFTFTKKNGTKTTIDTNLEKIAINFSYDAESQRLVITLDDGTIQYVDIKALITELEFLNSNTVLFSVSSDGKVSASIVKGSITADMIEPNYLANVQLYESKALISAETAKTEADRAKTEADRAEVAASSLIPDTELSETSTNTVQNKVITSAINSIRITNTNLLVNPNFRVNQRGLTEYPTLEGYTVDRWIAYGIQADSYVKINDNGSLELNKIDDFTQRVENGILQSGEKYTLSAKVNGNVYSITFTYEESIDAYGYIPFENSSFALHWIGLWGGFLKTAFVSIACPSSTITVEWIKLEQGKIATPFIAPNPWEELLKCGVPDDTSELGYVKMVSDSNKLNGYHASDFAKSSDFLKANTGWVAMQSVNSDGVTRYRAQLQTSGSLDLFKSSDSGATWTKVATWNTNYLPLNGGTLKNPLDVMYNGDATREQARILSALDGTACFVNRNADYTKVRQVSIYSKRTIDNPLNALYYQYNEGDGTWHTIEIFHAGNSTKVAIQESAPTDTSALWIW